MSAQLELQVKQNTEAINKLISQSKKLVDLPLFDGQLKDDDILMVYVDDLNQTVSIKFSNLSSLFNSLNLSDYYTKDQINAIILGLQWKDNVHAATTENIVLSGEQLVDGFQTNSSRILVRSQNDATKNGMYVTSANAWVRSTDADSPEELIGATVNVLNGTINAGFKYTCSNNSITLGVTEINWITTINYVEKEYVDQRDNAILILAKAYADDNFVKGIKKSDGTDLAKDENGIITLPDYSSGNTPAPSPEISYETVQEMLDDQVSQVEGKEYTVRDANAWSTIDHNGWATFEKKATSTASEEDYEEREQEDFDSIGAIKTGDIKLDNVSGNIYGDSSELTGNITIDDNFNRLGGVALIYHKANVAPTITTSLTKIIIPVGGSYTVGESNLISLSVIGANKLGIVYSQLTVNSVDTENPTAPTTITSTNITTSSFDVSWSGDSDNVGVTEYDIELNGVVVTGVTSPYSATGLQGGDEVNVRVRSKDAEGNVSNWSAIETVYLKLLAPRLTLSVVDSAQVLCGVSSYGIGGNDFSSPFTSDGIILQRATQSNFSDAVEVYNSTGNEPVRGVSGGRVVPDSALVYFRARVYDSAGNHPISDWAVQSIDTTPSNDVTPPSAPTNVQVSNITETGATVTWNTSTDGDTTPPSVPTGLAINNITETEATATWNASID